MLRFLSNIYSTKFFLVQICCNDCFAQTYSFKKKLERKEVSSQFHTYKNRDSATFKLV